MALLFNFTNAKSIFVITYFYKSKFKNLFFSWDILFEKKNVQSRIISILFAKFRKYQNARQDELWQFLSEQAHRDSVLPLSLDVKTIMDTWTLQMGYPVVTIQRNYTDGYVYIQQVRKKLLFIHHYSNQPTVKCAETFPSWS